MTLGEVCAVKIIGIGTDMISIDRIKKSLSKSADTFKNKIYTPHEIAYCDAKKAVSVGSYAKRWAAKEACAKALGTGIAHGVTWHDIEVQNDEKGAPVLVLSGGALERLNNLLPSGTTADIHLSLCDDDPWAQATVLISAYRS
jgi:holo-[acyl-carrier protein] synthase